MGESWLGWVHILILNLNYVLIGWSHWMAMTTAPGFNGKGVISVRRRDCPTRAPPGRQQTAGLGGAFCRALRLRWLVSCMWAGCTLERAHWCLSLANTQRPFPLALLVAAR